jgi:hypothetical protein
MDFKENVKVGGGPRETSHSWWNKIQFTLLDILVITSKNFHFYDFISEDLTHDSVFVKSCLTDLLKKQSFKDKKITKLHIWSDGGPHFHNYHLCDFFISLKNDDIHPFTFVEWNYFVEGHGKSYCDSHFSRVSTAVKDYENQVQSIRSITQLHQVLTKKFRYYSEVNNLLEIERKLPATVSFIVKPIVTRPKKICKATFENFKCFYSFVVDSFCKIKGKEMQHSTISTDLKVKRKEIKYEPAKLKVTTVKSVDLKPNKVWTREQTRQKLFKRKQFQIEKFKTNSIDSSNDVSPMTGVDFYDGEPMELESTVTTSRSFV